MSLVRFVRHLSRRLAALAAFVLAAPVFAQEIPHEVVIDFDDVPSLTTITDQYEDVLFLSASGYVNRALLSEAAASAPNLLCSGPAAGGVDCTQPTLVVFRVPVNGLRLTACGINASGGAIAFVHVWMLGAAAPVVVPIVATGAPRQIVHLEAFPRVVKVELTDIFDPSGLGWDDFAFTPIHHVSFDELPADSVLSTQYPFATFSTAPGYAPIVLPYVDDPVIAKLGLTPPNGLLVAAPDQDPTLYGPLTICFNCLAIEPVLGMVVAPEVGSDAGSFRIRAFAGEALLHEQVVALDDSTTIGKQQFVVPVSGVDRVEVDALFHAQMIYDNVWFETDEVASWKTYGQGWPGTMGEIPALTAAAPPYLATEPVLTIGNSSGQPTQCFLLIGLSKHSLPTPLGGTLLTSAELLVPLLLLGSDLTLTLPEIPPMACGARLYLQTLQHDPGASKGWAFSPGLELALGL